MPHLIQLPGLILYRSGNRRSDAKHFLVLDVMIGLTCVFLVLDWATQKDPSRKFSKLVDTVLGIV